MLQAVAPKLPMRNKAATLKYYTQLLGFTDVGAADYNGYLLVKRDNIELHFFAYPDIDPAANYGQVYIRTTDIEALYQQFVDEGVPIHEAGHLQTMPWGQREFALLDPDNNLLTFGESV